MRVFHRNETLHESPLCSDHEEVDNYPTQQKEPAVIGSSGLKETCRHILQSDIVAQQPREHQRCHHQHDCRQHNELQHVSHEYSP